MKGFKWLFHFLGGIYFAIFLIAAIALFAIAGTLLEARYDSHLYAAQWTYQSDLFAVLLAFLFINILVSAIRRWPFKPHHIPFLITHLGLLMIISGCLIKQRYGLQGNMFIMEGGQANSIMLPHTHALHVEHRDHYDPEKQLAVNIPFSVDRKKNYVHPLLPELTTKIQTFSPHVNEKFHAWIKGERAYIFGAPSVQVQNWKVSDPIQSQSIQFPFDLHNLWNVSVLRTDQIQDAIMNIYTEGLKIKLTPKGGRNTKSVLIPLSEALQNTVAFQDGTLRVGLNLTYSTLHELSTPVLEFDYQFDETGLSEKSRVPLQGNRALHHLSISENIMGSPFFEVDLERANPRLLVIEDSKGECHLFAYDRHGRIYAESLCATTPRSLIMYDLGFGGYSIQAKIPFLSMSSGRSQIERADQWALAENIRNALTLHSTLSPPLKLFQNACEQAQVDFPKTFIKFLTQWHRYHSLLLPEDAQLHPNVMRAVQKVNWSLLNENDLPACRWISFLCHRLESSRKNGESLFTFLSNNKWPFMKELEPFSSRSSSETMTQLAAKIFDLIAYLPSIPKQNSFTLGEKAHLLSAYFKAFGIEYHLLMPSSSNTKEDFSHIIAYNKEKGHVTQADPLVLEGPLMVSHSSEEPLNKLEDNRPGIVIQMHHGAEKQAISLAYDPTAEALKWPILHGRYLVRYQPQYLSIPYTVRLRQARQINYMDSSQPYSYESDIVISEKGQASISKTLSMNRVHETWDGYRFYLSGISTLSSGLKRIQIVVNYDPVKYYLTYPGGMIVSLGIILLFWIRPYGKRKVSR